MLQYYINSDKMQDDLENKEGRKIKNILEELETTKNKYPNKIAFGDIKRVATYTEIITNSQKIGSYIYKKTGKTNKPIAIFIDKSVNCLEAMFGALYSGNHYTVLDVKSPIERIDLILNSLEPIAIIADKKSLQKAQELGLEKNLFIYEEMLESQIDEENLIRVRNEMIFT